MGTSYNDQAADDVAAFITALGAGPAHLVGWSLGSTVAHMTVFKHADKVRSAYLLEGMLPLALTDEQKKQSRQSPGRRWRAPSPRCRHGDMPAMVRAQYDDHNVGEAGAFDKQPEAVREMQLRFAPLAVDIFKNMPKKPLICADNRALRVPAVLVRGTGTSPTVKESLSDRYWKDCVPTMDVPGATHYFPRIVAEFSQSGAQFAVKH